MERITNRINAKELPKINFEKIFLLRDSLSGRTPIRT
jgi:hypothetical protein